MLYYAVMKQGSQKIVFKNTHLEIAKEAVKTAISKLRQKWKIPADGFQESRKYRKWLIKLTRKKLFVGKHSPSLYSNFLQDIRDTILPLINKPPYWILFFATYITTGQIRDKIILRSGNTPTLPRINTIKSSIILELNANTTLSDIRKVWNKVRTLQKSLPDYETTRTRKKLLDDLALLEEISAGGSIKKIYSYQSTPNDAEDVRTPEASHKALQRLKKTIKGH